MIQDPIFYIVATVAILIVGISKSGFGGGVGVLAVPIMSLVMSPTKAAAIMLPLLILNDVFGIWHYRRSWDKTNLKIMLPAAVVGIVIGMFLFRYLSDAHIRIMIGVISVLFVINYFVGKRNAAEKTEPSVVKGGFWGAVAGFTSFGVHAGGPPVNLYLLPQKMDKTLFVGTTVVFFTIVNWVKLGPYFYLGQLNADNLLTSLVLSPLAPLGFWLGIKLHDKVNEKLFYNLAYFFLLITGVKLLIDGIGGL